MLKKGGTGKDRSRDQVELSIRGHQDPCLGAAIPALLSILQIEMEMPKHPRGIIACVIEDHPRDHLEVLRWFASVTKLAGVDPADLIVNVVGSTSTDVIRYMSARAVRVNTIVPFDSRSRRCNKIAGALKVAEQDTEGLVILTGSDIVFCRDPREIVVEPHSIASDVPAGDFIDATRQSHNFVPRVFAEAGVPLPDVGTLNSSADRLVIEGDGDAGVHAIPAGLFGRFTQSWQHWARWLLERRETLPESSFTVDQLAAALALSSEGIAWRGLPPWWNVSTHMLGHSPIDGMDPAIIQYHQDVGPTGLLLPQGVPHIDRQIELVNEAISSVFHEVFPNATFWEWRYTMNPALGSGVGSRGAALDEKRALIKRVITEIAPGSVLDVGCGDGRATEGLKIPQYRGLDVSHEAVRLTKARRPDAMVTVGTLGECFTTADLVICLDVLIHIADSAEYQELVGLLIEASQKGLLVAGYEKRPADTSPMTQFHEPLSTTIHRVAPRANLIRVRDVHGITTWLVMPQGSRPRATIWTWSYRMGLWRRLQMGARRADRAADSPSSAV